MTSGSERGRVRILGSLLGLGFLMLPREGSSTPLEDVEECLAQQRTVETERSRILVRADSLGFAAALADEEPSENLLREAERLTRRYSALGVDLLLRRELCRRLTAAALAECEVRITALQEAAREGRGGPDEAGELVRLQGLRAELQANLETPPVYAYPILPLGPDDTEETLLAKQQYYTEVEGILDALDARIDERLGQVRDEAEALRQAQRLVGDLAFVDVGDRATDDVITRDKIHSDPPGRPLPEFAIERGESDLDFALRVRPTTVQGIEEIVSMLERYRESVGDQLAAIQQERERVESRLP